MNTIFDKLFLQAGITVNGNRPWDIQIHDDRFYKRVLKDYSIGLGESYMEGWWDCEQIDEVIAHLLNAQVLQKLQKSPRDLISLISHQLFNFQTRSKGKEVAEKHYNLGNVLYQRMLGKTMCYSCAYWKNAANLDEAQQNKMELICRKLMLRPGMRLLDIGCGWGSLAKYAAERYGVEVVGTTISVEQKHWTKEACAGLPIKILLNDYRDLPLEVFDRIVSVGMFEHVGYKNYDKFMQGVFERLSNDGIFLLHTIGSNASYTYGDKWLTKYIFPNGMLPSIAQIGKAIENRFVMEDWQNFGVYYDQTLLAWHHNFNAHWDELKSTHDERFKRMWNYYLLSCAGAFRARQTQLWQVVLSKHGLKDGFQVNRG